MFGAWSQVLVAFALLSNVLEFGFFHSFVQYIPGAARGQVGRILHVVLAVVIGNGFVFVLICWMFPHAISEVVFATDADPAVVLATGIFIVSECLVEILTMGFLRADGRIRLCSIYYAIKSVARLLLLWQGLYGGADLSGLLWRLSWSNIILFGLVYTLHVAPTLSKYAEKLRPGFWPAAFAHSGTIVLSSNLAWANASLGRFVIVHLLGLSQLGLYAANLSLASPVSLISLVLNFTAIPHINAAWNNGDSKRAGEILSGVTEYYFFVSAPIGISLGLFYQPIAKILIHGDFFAGPLLIWTLIASIFLQGLEQLLSFTTFMGNSRFSVMTRSCALAVGLLVNLAFMNRWGVSTAAIAASLSSIIVIAANIVFLNRLGGFLFPWKGVAWIGLASGVMTVLASVVLGALGEQTFVNAVIAGIAGLLPYLAVEALRKRSIGRQLLRRIYPHPL
jgi:O-antigen/teichoic acid export membrane protein